MFQPCIRCGHIEANNLVRGMVGTQHTHEWPADLRRICTERLSGLSCTDALHPGATAGASCALPPQAQYEAVRATRAWYGSAEGKQQYKQRAGVEGTLSQAVRSYGLRYA